MKNVTHKVEGNKLTIVIDLNEDLGPSKSGKTQMIASTYGNVAVPGCPAEFRLSINAYKPKA